MGGGFMIGQMEGETISDRSQDLFPETNHHQIIPKNTINVKRTNHREAMIVMPGHTTAVKGVVFQDQFVR